MGDLLGVADRVLDWLFELPPVLIYLLTWLFTALETTALIGLVVPGDAVVLLAGSTVTSPMAFVAVVLAASLGSLTGELGGYLIGRVVGPRLRYSRLGRRLGEHRWAAAEAYLHGRGGPALAGVRFVAVLHAVVPLVAGTVRMPFRRFAGWSALGALTWAVTFTGLGLVAGAAYREYGHVSLVLSGVVVAAITVGSFARRRWRDRRRAAHARHGEGGRPESDRPVGAKRDGDGAARERGDGENRRGAAQRDGGPRDAERVERADAGRRAEGSRRRDPVRAGVGIQVPIYWHPPAGAEGGTGGRPPPDRRRRT